MRSCTLGWRAYTTVVVGGCSGKVCWRCVVIWSRKNARVVVVCEGCARYGKMAGLRVLGTGSARLRMAVVIALVAGR